MTMPAEYTKKRTYPEPIDLGNPPDELRNWTEKVIATWNLTVKEAEITWLMLKGLKTKEIADMLGNTDKTLKHHMATIFRKAHVESRSQLFAEILRV
jgi:DNA-binding CsgD family transcriptional regulator